MARRVKILVCGGGIAGNSIALQLLKFGFNVTVVERAEAPRPGGQGVSLRGTACDVARSMGIYSDVRKRALLEEGMVVVNSRGRVRARMPAAMTGGDRFLSDIEISRGDLVQILLEKIVEESNLSTGSIAYRYDQWVESLADDRNGVVVGFASGESEKYDLVVGADGLHSSVREMVFGPHDQFKEFLGAYVGFFSMGKPSASDLGSGWGGVYPSPGVAVGVRNSPQADKATAIINIRTSSTILRVRGDVMEQQELIRRSLACGGWLVPEVLAAMPEADDFYFDEVTRVNVPSWSKGRVVLLGDAAYCGSPMTGMGTSLAIVGAYILANEIAKATDSPEYALRQYEQLMRPQVSRVQRGTRLMVRALLPKTKFSLQLRLALLAAAVSKPAAPLRAALSGVVGKIGSFDFPVDALASNAAGDES